MLRATFRRIAGQLSAYLHNPGAEANVRPGRIATRNDDRTRDMDGSDEKQECKTPSIILRGSELAILATSSTASSSSGSRVRLASPGRLSCPARRKPAEC